MIKVFEQADGVATLFILQRNIYFLTHGDLLLLCMGTCASEPFN
jgi:hypothetical protein